MIVTKPPMGWNSWNTFTKDIDEKLIMQTADAMVESGLLNAGYEYLVIDDCWSEKKRDENGMLIANHVKFPHGMKYVADYVHSKGLKFGMYSCCGTFTCAGYPGSFGHEFDDAKYFAEVGVDLLKYDNCYSTSMENRLAYLRMSLALRSCGRDIVFSACNWGTNDVHGWARQIGAHMYRSTYDITDTFESIKELSESQKDKLIFSANNCFNDIDMLITGLKGQGNIGFGNGCTDANYRYHFAFWCLASSPLMIGCDVRSLSSENKTLLTNPLLIRINQDEECRPPMFIGENEYCAFKVLSNGDYAFGFFNPMDKERHIFLNAYELGLMPSDGVEFEMTDVFTGEKCENFTDVFNVAVPAGDVRMFIGKAVKK